MELKFFFFLSSTHNKILYSNELIKKNNPDHLRKNWRIKSHQKSHWSILSISAVWWPRQYLPHWKCKWCRQNPSHSGRVRWWNPWRTLEISGKRHEDHSQKHAYHQRALWNRLGSSLISFSDPKSRCWPDCRNKRSCRDSQKRHSSNP